MNTQVPLLLSSSVLLLSVVLVFVRRSRLVELARKNHKKLPR
jgi:hypothetical protein